MANLRWEEGRLEYGPTAFFGYKETDAADDPSFLLNLWDWESVGDDYKTQDTDLCVLTHNGHGTILKKASFAECKQFAETL